MSEHLDSKPLEHQPDCPGGRLVRRETDRRHLLICVTCGALKSTPHRNEWRDTRREDQP